MALLFDGTVYPVLFHLAAAAFLAISVRRSGVKIMARASPPLPFLDLGSRSGTWKVNLVRKDTAVANWVTQDSRDALIRCLE